MNYVVAVSYKGPQTMTKEDGKVIPFNNVNISYITDNVPAKYQDGDLKIWCSEVKLSVDKVSFIGVEDLHELTGKFIEFGVTISGGAPIISTCFVVPAPKNVDILTDFAKSLSYLTANGGSK